MQAETRTEESALLHAFARSCMLSSASCARTARVSGLPARPHGLRTSPFTGPDFICTTDALQRFLGVVACSADRSTFHWRDAANAVARNSAGRCDDVLPVTESRVVATANVPNHAAAPARPVLAIATCSGNSRETSSETWNPPRDSSPYRLALKSSTRSVQGTTEAALPPRDALERPTNTVARRLSSDEPCSFGCSQTPRLSQSWAFFGLAQVWISKAGLNERMPSGVGWMQHIY